MRQGDPAAAAFEVPFVLPPPAGDLLQQGLPQRPGQHDDAVLVPLAAADQDLTPLEVEVMDAQPQAFHLPQPGPVQQLHHEAEQAAAALDGLDHPANLLDGSDQGEPCRPRRPDVVEPAEVDVQHLLVQEHEGVEGLRLRADRDVSRDGEVREELGDVGGPEVGGVALVVEQDEAAGPIDVAVLGAAGVVADAEDVPDLVEEAGAVSAGPRPQVAGESVLRPADVGRQVAERLTEYDLIQEVEGGAGFDLGGGDKVGGAPEVVEEGGDLGSAISWGWRTLWKKMYRRAQST